MRALMTRIMLDRSAGVSGVLSMCPFSLLVVGRPSLQPFLIPSVFPLLTVVEELWYSALKRPEYFGVWFLLPAYLSPVFLFFCKQVRHHTTHHDVFDTREQGVLAGLVRVVF
jgi:hypothetical protein